MSSLTPYMSTCVAIKEKLNSGLDPVGLARNRGFTKHELNRVERLVVEHARIVMDTWHDYFAP